MKRLFTLLLLAVILLSPATAGALPVADSQFDISKVLNIKIDEPKKAPRVFVEPAKPVEPPKPVPVVYSVVSGDNLTKIGTAYNVEWQRLWAKNTQLTHPDLIHVGDQITIPFPDEVLDRALPAIVSLPEATPGVVPLANYDGGNTYDYGYCTWYVKNRRGASLPNMLGNANTWYTRAQAAGMAVGSEPRAGAVGTTTRGSLGHVVYVESVNADGTVNISEMNYKGFGIQSSRTTSASEFVYIY
jgi:LysM repeat protein